MKKIVLLICILVFSACLSNCSSKKDFYGTYYFDKVSYHSPLLSTSPDYVEERMKGTIYTINGKVFRIESPEYTEEFISPIYLKEEIPQTQDFFSDVRSFIGEELEYQYNIYTKEGNPTHYRLYILKDSLLVAFYNDNVADETEIIMHIYKLSKA